MNAEQNKEIVRRFFNEVCDGRDLDLADDLFAPDHIYHGPESTGPVIFGAKGIKDEVARYQSAFNDARWIVNDIFVAEKDQVIVLWTGQGRHTGPLQGFQPTGRDVSVQGTWVSRVRKGRIVESWGMWDTLRLAQQLRMME